MNNIIDMCNYLLKNGIVDSSSDIYEAAQAEALELCLKHGDEFVLGFMREYLKVVREEIQNDYI